MGLLILTSYFLAQVLQVSLPPQSLNLKVESPNILLSSKPSGLSPGVFEVLPQPLGEVVEEQCRDVPSGNNIPGFQPGIMKNDVLRMLGTPTRISGGYWPNTRAVSYELIPEQVSLGFLFDRRSQRIRQTEASFKNGVNSQIVLMTLNSMLGCKINEPIQRGLQQVQKGQFKNYYFKLNTLEGVIEQQKNNRIYIGIWEEDLH
ncbi:MAG: hypothetical protein WBG73_19605 [Coleofasciculaceae cyanobacterium]